MNRRIRPAGTGDLAFLKACAEAAYAQYVERIGRRPAPMTADFAAQQAAGLIHVLEVDDTPAGFIVHYDIRPGVAHVESVAVLPDFAGQGLGIALVGFAESAARARGATVMELYTNAAMRENLRYYPRLGYETLDEREEDGFRRVYFRKLLG